jgi:hypothetical protein
MDFLIFVGEIIWALAGFLDLLKRNPLADFLMGGFNARVGVNNSSHVACLILCSRLGLTPWWPKPLELGSVCYN